MGDRFFDLANFAANHDLTDDESSELLRGYFGELRPDDERLAAVDALHVGLPRGDVGRRAAGDLGARLRLRRRTRTSTSSGSPARRRHRRSRQLCGGERPCAGRRRRRRRRRLLDPVLARAPRVRRRRPRRARRPDERLDLPLRRPRRAAPRLDQPDEDDDELGRAVPHARRGGGAGDGLARGRLATARVVGGADGGDRPAGGLGEDVRARRSSSSPPRRPASSSRRCRPTACSAPRTSPPTATSTRAS